MPADSFDANLSGLRERLKDPNVAPTTAVALPPAYGRLMAATGVFAALAGAAAIGLPKLADTAPAPVFAPQFVNPAVPLANAPAASDPGLAVNGAGACNINVPPEGVKVIGKALGPVPLEVGDQSAHVAEAKVHGNISPEYLGKPREFISVHWGNATGTWYAVIPPGMVVKPGDTVEMLTRHRDATKPCNFVPYLLTGVVSSGG